MSDRTEREEKAPGRSSQSQHLLSFTADTIQIDLREKTTFAHFACAQHIPTKAIYICVAL